MRHFINHYFTSLVGTTPSVCPRVEPSGSQRVFHLEQGVSKNGPAVQLPTDWGPWTKIGLADEGSPCATWILSSKITSSLFSVGTPPPTPAHQAKGSHGPCHQPFLCRALHYFCLSSRVCPWAWPHLPPLLEQSRRGLCPFRAVVDRRE